MRTGGRWLARLAAASTTAAATLPLIPALAGAAPGCLVNQVCLYTSPSQPPVSTYQDTTSVWQNFSGSHTIKYVQNNFDPNTNAHVVYFRHGSAPNALTSCAEPRREASVVIDNYAEVTALQIHQGNKCYSGSVPDANRSPTTPPAPAPATPGINQTWTTRLTFQSTNTATAVGASANIRAEGHTAICTIVGTSGDDALNGTAKDDVICGGGGNDLINGNGGNDTIFGGPGKDTLIGKDGDDSIYGDAGDDLIRGGAGDDRIFGDSDSWRPKPQPSGADRIFGGAGSDGIEGGPGNDRIDTGSNPVDHAGQDMAWAGPTMTSSLAGDPHGPTSFGERVGTISFSPSP